MVQDETTTSSCVIYLIPYPPSSSITGDFWHLSQFIKDFVFCLVFGQYPPICGYLERSSSFSFFSASPHLVALDSIRLS